MYSLNGLKDLVARLSTASFSFEWVFRIANLTEHSPFNNMKIFSFYLSHHSCKSWILIQLNRVIQLRYSF